jgi:hypothetical protein
VTAYVNNLHATAAASGSARTLRPPTTRPHDPSCECYACVASASSSFDPEPAPRHRSTDAQRRVRLDEPAEARCQLNEELAILHQEPGQDPEPRNRHLAPLPALQMVPVQEQPRKGNDEQQECRPAAERLESMARRHWLEDAHVTTIDAPTRV